eukprot:COSAG02_NODE_15581_length_1158_cov_1.499528_2_plen_241_part_01
MLASPPPPAWRGRPRGVWHEEEAARERLRTHRRLLKHARATIEVKYRAPLPRRPVLLPGLPAPLISGKARRRRPRQRRAHSVRAPGRRAFVPLLQPIDEATTARARELPEPSMHYGPAPPAYRPSQELVAAIVQFQTEELEEALEQLRLRRAEDAATRRQEEDAAVRAVAQAETWDASADVCMVMVKDLQEDFRTSRKQLLELQRRFVASRTAAKVAGPADTHQRPSKMVVAKPRSARPHY